MTLKWMPPDDPGSSSVTGYYVEKDDFTTGWSQVNRQPIPDTEYTVADLTEGSRYHFRIAAVNKAGVGKYSDSSYPVVAEQVLGDSSACSSDEIGIGVENESNDTTKTDTLSPLEKLNKWRTSILEEGRPVSIYYDRDARYPLRQLIGIYKQGLNLKIHPMVHFISGNEEELAVDTGGPRREFFHLSMNTVLTNQEEPMFERQRKHLVPINRQSVMAEELFELVGKMLSHSILHTGCGLNGIAKPIIHYIIYGDIDLAANKVVMEDIADVDLQETLKKVLDADVDELKQLGPTLVDILSYVGASHYEVTTENRNVLVYEVMQHSVLLSRKIQMDQLRRGLNYMGLLKVIADEPELVDIVFPEENIIAYDVLKNKVELRDGETIDNEDKEKNFAFFHKYLEQKCESQDAEHGDEPTIYDVLMFITGYRSIPPKVFVKFSNSTTVKLPDPGVCTEEIVLPVCHATYNDFKHAFDTTVKCQGTGYGRY